MLSVDQKLSQIIRHYKAAKGKILRTCREEDDTKVEEVARGSKPRTGRAWTSGGLGQWTLGSELQVSVPAGTQGKGLRRGGRETSREETHHPRKTGSPQMQGAGYGRTTTQSYKTQRTFLLCFSQSKGAPTPHPTEGQLFTCAFYKLNCFLPVSFQVCHFPQKHGSEMAMGT